MQIKSPLATRTEGRAPFGSPATSPRSVPHVNVFPNGPLSEFTHSSAFISLAYPHFGQRLIGVLFGFTTPQCGQLGASDETSLLHSRHSIKAMDLFAQVHRLGGERLGLLLFLWILPRGSG